jgi:acyl transferase domain-containing protein/surfactin synthase thioesterase subunit/acyl carrier protein
MACRLPGANTPAEFWRNLCGGVESIRFFSAAELLAAGAAPSDVSNPRYVRAAPVIEGVGDFDASFFGYSPREAALLDPQQRLLLEVACETFEDAGYDPQQHDEVVGVFAGAGGVLTSYLAAHPGHPALAGQTGSLEHISNDKDFLSTRVSYELNLTGPSLTVQTACSTSLVAVHLACQSLLSGECDMALAGASSVRIPHLRGYVAEENSIYSTDGHCRSFDASGTGTIFGSGVAAVLLKPLAAAIADGDHVYAVIRGTAINNDGGRKASYTAPSVIGEARAMIEALEVAEVDADSVGYVECHATGTVVGDPLEIRALTQAFRAHSERVGFCAVGSAKTNIGHAEQTAGLAGLIKTALILEHGVIPPTLHLTTPNPEIRFAETPFYVPTSVTPWPEANRSARRRAGVNSLGIGGTNAFAVLEEAPASFRARTEERTAHLLCISARSATALSARVGQLRQALESPATDLGDLCFTANTSRSSLPHRAVFEAPSRETFATKLGAFVETDSSLAHGQLGPVAWLFTGQGSQYAAMGADLLRTQPVFRAAIEACDAIFRQEIGESLLDLLVTTGEPAEVRLRQTIFTQPAVFAVDYALAQVWDSWGLRPAAVIGHSLGEIAAACVAGAFSLEDGFRFVIRRASLMQSIDAPGAMAAILADEGTVRGLLETVSANVEIASLNGPRNTVVSGPRAAVEEMARRCDGAGVSTQLLPVSHAFHSAMMEPVLSGIEALEEAIGFHEPAIPLVSNVTGQPIKDIRPGYWRHHARRPVRFSEGMAALENMGITSFIEVGPGSALLSMGRQSLPNFRGRWLASLDRRREGWASLLHAAGELYRDGFAPRWSAVEAGFARRRLPLPTYPFERRTYWLKPAKPLPPPAGDQTAAMPSPPSTPPEMAVDLGRQRREFLANHRTHGWTIMPTAAVVLDAVAACRSSLGEGPLLIEQLRYHRPLLLAEHVEARVKVTVSAAGPDALAVALLAEANGSWREHARATLRRSSTGDVPETSLQTAPNRRPGRGWTKIPPERFYRELSRSGLEYGPSSRTLTAAWTTGPEVRARIEVPVRIEPAHRTTALLDACINLFPLVLPTAPGGDPTVFLPVGIQRLVLGRLDTRAARVHLRRTEVGNDGRNANVDVEAIDDKGRLVARISGMSLRLTTRRDLHSEGAPLLRDLLYACGWQAEPPAVESNAAGASPRAWVLFADRGGVAAAVAKRLQRAGDHCHLVFERAPASVRDNVWSLDPERPQAYRALLEKIASVETSPFSGVMFASALDVAEPRDLAGDRLATAERIALRGALYTAQALTANPAFRDARLWTLTRGAHSVSSEEAPSLGQAPLLGLARTFALEHPQQWGASIDLSPRPDSPVREADTIVTELFERNGEGQVAFREGVRHVARLGRHIETGEPLRYRRDATYLITGGLGMIGLRTARWLVETQGVRHLVLTGRHGAKGKGQEALAGLRRAGARVRVIKADVSRRTDVVRLLKVIDRRGPPLKGLIHCAGALADGVLAKQTWDRFSAGTTSKVHGAWLLHELTQAHGLDVFLLHSSILSLIGSVGQANYTAANAFLDALCDYRRAMGLPAMAINWGPWDESGMAKDGGAGGAKLWNRLGTQMIPPDTGMHVLEHLHEIGASRAALTICHWPTYVDRSASGGRLYARLLADTAAADGPPETPSLMAGDLLTTLQAIVTAELGFEESIDVHRSLNDLGLDSLMAVNLVNRVDSKLGVRLPLARVIQGPSLRQLVAEIEPQLTARAASSAAVRATPPSSRGAAKGSWVVIPKPNPAARVRLVCFPFAGGGAATFRPWADSLHPSIELVGIEPPGRATRIREPPVRSMSEFLAGVMPELLARRDKPLALFGHCLGALTLIEVARRLASRRDVALTHLFLSGSRPPALLKKTGRFEENLLRQLLANTDYDPLVAMAEQPESAFGMVLRQFDIGATDEFLSKPELRRLLLPAIRADFHLADRYHPPPRLSWDVPITYFAALGDPYVTRAQAMGWAEHTTRAFRIHFRGGAHFMVAEDREFIVATINQELGAERTPRPAPLPSSAAVNAVNDR